MKKFIAFFCMITMMVVMPPGKVQAYNNQSPGSCFISQVDIFAPAATLQVDATTTVMQYLNVSICTPSNPPGQPITDYCTNKPIIMKVPNLQMVNIDFRLCYYDVIAARNLKLLQVNKVSVLPVTIRKLTQV